MKNIFDLEHEAIAEMDKVCEKLGIQWHGGGQEIRRALTDAINDAFLSGVKVGEQNIKEATCFHQWTYTNKGGTCSKCGAKTLQCCSD